MSCYTVCVLFSYPIIYFRIMRRFCFTILVLFCCLPTLFASEQKFQASGKERFRQYLAGIKYLEAANRLVTEDQIAYYNKLVEITGFTAQKAQTYLKKYQDDPKQWLKVIESVMEIINTPLNKEEE